MLTKEQAARAKERTIEYFNKACIAITPEEIENLEVADFGLDKLESIGLEILVYVNTERVCAKELVMFPNQTCPEHIHPPVDGQPGKEETFRCRWGKVYLYVPGPKVKNPGVKAPAGHEDYFTVWNEIVLNPGDQYTLMPETLHWFQAGPEGAVVSEFSTRSRDDVDIFTDPGILRIPVIEE
ncbi:MAG: D-lyxose/D-mannose family sugar isomerase [Armatimonadota bacterium]